MKNNQKCVRLSDAVCALVEQQAGDNFSEKFGNLVILAHEALPRVAAEKKQLEQECTRLRERIEQLRQNIGDLQTLDMKQTAMIHAMDDFSRASAAYIQGLK